MKNFVDNILNKTLENENFRKVLFTAKHCQLVVMTLLPGEEIGTETHHKVDQFIRIEQGSGLAVLDGEEFELKDDFALVITAGTEHNIINTSKTEKMKLYSLYSPPNHPEGTIHKNKTEAEEYEKQEHH